MMTLVQQMEATTNLTSLTSGVMDTISTSGSFRCLQWWLRISTMFVCSVDTISNATSFARIGLHRPLFRQKGRERGREGRERGKEKKNHRASSSRLFLQTSGGISTTLITINNKQEGCFHKWRKGSHPLTVVGVLYLPKDESFQSSGCGRNCLGKCCLPGSKLPLYAFNKNGEDFMRGKAISMNLSVEDEEIPEISFLNTLLGEWEERMRRGLFRYDVTTCETKIIPGQYGFIAQLNEGRHLKKRPTEFRVDQVLQPFDENKFNFTKVGQEEVLFRFEPSDDGKTLFDPDASISAGGSQSSSVVAINVSPIEYGHVLLIPRVLDCLPQRIDPDSFLLAMHMATEAADPFFRLGYNSLGAFATINHLHFQAYCLAVPFPVEKAPTRKIAMVKGLPERGLVLSQLLNYPVRGLVFERGNTMRDLSNVVASSCICLQDNNIPYNVLISDCGKRVFIFPQCYAEKQALGEVSQQLLDTQVNPAVWEISGHMVLKRKKDYEDASEHYPCRLLAEVSLSEERFEEVKAYILEAAGLQEACLGAKDSIEQQEEVVFGGACSHPSSSPRLFGSEVIQ
ncbi:hypothetical protein NE237_007620 [Protea cynaroides]|uniref:GDP-D-glucose phosphorylase 1 n=1 Tax=Protea cynaroides TaxID=273540 RepID=A0A9Q0KQE4_9MAGN|nr:hypothetical protein NE237_007620 [Protea cynaroides]